MPQESFLLILTQDEIKDDICAASGQIDELGEEMREMRILNKNSKHNLRISRPRYTEQEKLVHELFADNLSPKSIIEHPFNEDLEDVHGSPIDDKAFNTFRDYLVLFRLPAIIRQVKDEFKIDTGKLILRYYWHHDEKKSSTTPSSVQSSVEADNDSASGEDLRPSSSPIEKSNSTIVFSQTAGRSEQSDKTKTGKRRRSTVEKGIRITKKAN
ncbi:hypothetical protein AB4K20DRAFT_1968912 [Rhizopus microsporus]